MKYKVGDKVRILKSSSEYFVEKIVEMIGKEYYIDKVEEDAENYVINGYYFDEDEIELVEEVKQNTTKLLLVEDGSVDVDELKEFLEGTNIKVVVYRQGAKMPEIIDLEE